MSIPPPRRQALIFLVLTALLVVVAIGRSVLSYRSQAPFRDNWSRVVATLEEQQQRIDALSAELETLDTVVDEGKVELQRLGDEIAVWERQARRGRLPSDQYRSYRAAIDRHNAFVTEHNRNIVDMRGAYSRYSALVDSHNGLVDSANGLQRTAVQQGIQLPPADLWP